MEINLIFFGELAEMISMPNIELQDNGDTVALVDALYGLYPALKNKSFLLAVNHQLITTTKALKHNDVVAFMPPFSGG